MFAPLISGAAWSSGGKVLQLTLTLLAMAVIARLVGPESYGLFALSGLVVGLFEVVVNSAPMDTLVQRKEVVDGHLNATFLAAMAMALGIWGGLYLLADSVENLLAGGPVLAAIIPFRAAVLPLQALAVVPYALLLRSSRFKAASGAETLSSVASNGAGLALAWSGAGIWTLIGMEVVRASVMCGALFWLARWRPGVRLQPSHLKDLLAFNLSTVGSWGLGYLSVQIPRFFIASTFGVQAIGFYALAQRLYDQVTQIIMVPAYQVVQVGMSKASAEERVVRRLMEGSLRVTAVIACPLYLGLAAVAPILVPAVFGQAWLGAAPVVQIMMILGILSSLSVIQAAVIRGLGKPHWEMGYEAVLVLVSTVLVVLALPFGLMATTTAVVVSHAVAAPLKTVLVRRLTGVSLHLQATALVHATAAALVMAVFASLLLSMLGSVTLPLASLAICIGLSMIVYWMMLAWLMPDAAAVIRNIVVALAFRDPAALRASLSSLAG